jgi:hypothetical protein
VIGVEQGSEGGAQAARANEVLHRERQSVQRRQRFTADGALVRRLGLLDRLLRRHRDEGVDLRLQALDLCQVCIGELARG